MNAQQHIEKAEQQVAAAEENMVRLQKGLDGLRIDEINSIMGVIDAGAAMAAVHAQIAQAMLAQDTLDRR